MAKDPNSFEKLAERIWDASIQIEQIVWLAGVDADSPPDNVEELIEDYLDDICAEVAYTDVWSGKPYTPKAPPTEETLEDDELEDDEDEKPSAGNVISHCIDERKQGFLVEWSWRVPQQISEDGKSWRSGAGRYLAVFYTEAFDAALLDRMEAKIQERWLEIYEREHGKPFRVEAEPTAE